VSFEGIVRRLEQAGMIVAGTCVVFIMAITCWDAGGRYLVGRPLSWSFDLVSNYLLVLAAWFAVASTYQRNDHICINLLHARMPRRMRVAADFTCGLLALALFCAIGWGTAVHAQEAWANKEFYPGAIVWPAWLSYAPIPIGAALLALRLVHHLAMLAVKGEDPFIESDGEEFSE
jgi:TRAP-type C4-dicarboxylate transport system permease small subunit